jgi:septum formation protein
MIILASQSPRRKEILKEILKDIPFLTIPSSFDESQIKDDDVLSLCLKEAKGKGLDVSSKHLDDIVIASDTMVMYKNKQLGKPKDYDDAFNTIKMLQGNTHQIVTAYVIIKNGQILKERVCVAHLFIEKMDDEKIKKYLATKSPFDKAGSYGIQDSEYITSKIIDGSRYTIIGLPKDELEEDLKDLNII